MAGSSRIVVTNACTALASKHIRIRGSASLLATQRRPGHPAPTKIEHLFGRWVNVDEGIRERGPPRAGSRAARDRCVSSPGQTGRADGEEIWTAFHQSVMPLVMSCAGSPPGRARPVQWVTCEPNRATCGSSTTTSKAAATPRDLQMEQRRESQVCSGHGYRLESLMMVAIPCSLNNEVGVLVTAAGGRWLPGPARAVRGRATERCRRG